jgi:3-methyladenine DNA glycosylase AlkD
MPARATQTARKSPPAKPAPSGLQRPVEETVQEALSALEGMSTRRDRDNLARFNIDAPKAFGVSMANIQKVAGRLGRDHDLAAALWKTGWYEARMLTSFVDEPDRVTAAQMDRWCRDFDNWAICDTLCFNLFDRTPHAWAKVEQWSG